MACSDVMGADSERGRMDWKSSTVCFRLVTFFFLVSTFCFENCICVTAESE